jgi:gliding motility-associated lipoprotein GldB
MIKKLTPVLFLAFALLNACSNKNRFDIDVSDVSVNLEVKRLDQDLFEIDPANLTEKIPELIDNYGEFFELYSYRVIRLGNPYAKGFGDSLVNFVTNYHINLISEKVREVFPAFESYEQELISSFKRYKYYFPERDIPTVYTYIGGFNQSIVVADSILGIGVDKYLGEDCEFYDRLGIANYMQQNMNPENVSVDAMRAWISTEFVYNDKVDNLVNNMVYQGKIQYLLDALMPEVQDSLKMGFTGEQTRWCIQNEKQMWNYLIENKLLFSTDYMTINKHINPAPFTSGYPQNSPGRASVWLGWQIVKAYMHRNQEVSVKDLMLDDDYQRILAESRYEP